LQINAYELAKKYNVSLSYVYAILRRLGKGKKSERSNRIMSELVDEVNKRVAIPREEIVSRGLLWFAKRLVWEGKILRVKIVCRDKRVRTYYCSKERLKETAKFVYENYEPSKRNPARLMYNLPRIIYETILDVYKNELRD